MSPAEPPPGDEASAADTLLHAGLVPPPVAGLEHEQRRRAVEAALFGEASEALIVGRYRLLDRIGEGGMGSIFAATSTLTGEAVAIKVMQGQGHDPRRFDREIAVLAGLEHPRIVRYVDHGTTDDGRPYLVMERLRGEDLRVHLGRRRPSARAAVTLGIHVAEGLAAAHTRGCIHRDIKPSNLFLVDGEVEGVKIVDFGIARARGGTASVTRTGMILGTLGYMAPEQACGDPHLDHRADLFSLGCVLYEALAGQPPFPGEHAVAILGKILLDEPPPLSSLRPDLPPGLAVVIHQALAKRPEARPPTAEALAAALRACVDEAAAEPEPALAVPVISYREQQALCLLLIAEEATAIDPEAATHVQAIDPATRRAAEAHGASLTPVLGGAEILAFAVDGALADAALAAARCALAIRGERPRVRLALALGRGEQRGDSVVGEVLDRVSRLAAAGEAGVIVVDPASARALGSAFTTEAVGDQLRLVGEHEEPTLPRLLGKPSPFVGRARELGWLGGLFDHACEVGRACAARIVAPPGLGKSRLWREFARGLAAAGHEPRVLVIRCAATLQASALGALGAALRRAAGVVGADRPGDAREKVLVRFGAAGARQAGFLAELCGVDVDEARGALALARPRPTSSADAQRLAWLDWLQAEAAARPVLLVVEDLHWCDEGTADFVRAAATDLADRPLMVIATARPEADERFPAAWPIAGVERLELAPLSARAGEALVRRALGPVDDAALASLVARADGNPLFLEELVRAARDGEPDGVPESVLSVLEARLRRLGEEARRVLRAASVFDGAFDPAAVAGLLGAPEAAARAQIDALVAAELLVRDRGDDDGLFRFRHALVQGAAYATLTDVDRPPAHRAAAAWLAAAGGYEPAAIAGHYARGDDPAAAAGWYVQAARRAIACADVAAARAHAARALECEVAGEALAEVRVVEADVALWAGDVTAADRQARQALAVAVPGGEVWFTAIRRRLSCAFSAMRLDEVRALCEALRPFAGVASDERLLCLAEAAYALCVSGAVDEARALFAEAWDLADVGATSALVRGSIHRVRAAIAAHQQRLWASLQELQRAVLSFEEGGDLRSACRMRSTLAWLWIALGALDRADASIDEGLRVADRVGADHPAFYLGAVLAALRVKQGRVDEARRRLDALLERAAARGERRIYGYALLFRASLDDDDGDDGLARIRAGIEALRPFASTHLLGTAHLARRLARRGDLGEATALARDGLARLRASGSALDDAFFGWAVFVDVLDQAGAADEADLAVAEALARLARLHAEIEEPALRRSFLAVDAVARLLARARGRGIAIPAALDPAIV